MIRTVRSNKNEQVLNCKFVNIQFLNRLFIECKNLKITMLTLKNSKRNSFTFKSKVFKNGFYTDVLILQLHMNSLQEATISGQKSNMFFLTVKIWPRLRVPTFLYEKPQFYGMNSASWKRGYLYQKFGTNSPFLWYVQTLILNIKFIRRTFCEDH